MLICTCCQPWLVDLNLRAQATTSVFFTSLTAPSSAPCRQWDPNTMQTDPDFRSHPLGIASIQPLSRDPDLLCICSSTTFPESRLQIMFLASTQGLTLIFGCASKKFLLLLLRTPSHKAFGCALPRSGTPRVPASQASA